MNLTWDALADPKSFRSHRKFHTGEKSGKKSLVISQISKKEFYFHKLQENAATEYYGVLPHANNC